jgi:hypothetical protein
LLDGGFLEVAPDIATAAEQLARIVDGADDRMKKRAAFVASFLRPCGIDRPAAHAVVDLIEATARGMETSPRHSRAAEAFAHRAIPRLRSWATRRATAEARERIAAHVAQRDEKHGEARSSRLLFMVPDAAAATALLPTLELLSRDRDRSHVAVSRTATDAAAATQLQGLYTGLTIGHAPAMEDVEMRRLSIVDFLEERRPDLLVVARSGDAAVDKEYIDAARAVGVRTVLLHTRWTDFRPAGNRVTPAADVITVWNEHQRARLLEGWQLPAERIQVTGALVPSDASGRKVVDARAQLCARTGLDASHPIVVFVAPAATSASLLSAFQEWRHLLAASEEKSASVVVYVERAEQVQLWRRMAADARIAVARPGDDQERALVRLDETLSGADVVVAVDMPLVLEAGVRGRPLIAWLNAGDAADSELARFADMFAADGWPYVARTAADAARAVVETIAKQRGNPQPSNLVRPSADATGAARLCRLLQHAARGRSGALASDGGEVGVDHRLERLGGIGGR